VTPAPALDDGPQLEQLNHEIGKHDTDVLEVVVAQLQGGALPVLSPLAERRPVAKCRAREPTRLTAPRY
jgi:hypothetical protein